MGVCMHSEWIEITFIFFSFFLAELCNERKVVFVWTVFAIKIRLSTIIIVHNNNYFLLINFELEYLTFAILKKV